MRTSSKLLPYSLAVAAALSTFVIALTMFFPAPQEQAQAANARQVSVSPRIAAWQERIAEEKVYEERAAIKLQAEKAASLAAQQQARETAKLRAAAAAPVMAATDKREDRRFEDRRAQELAKERARAKQFAAQQDRQFGLESAYGYAPEPSRARFNTIYSSMREMRGGN